MFCINIAWAVVKIVEKVFLPDRESNPGLPRDRRRSLPLDYRGFVVSDMKHWPAGHDTRHWLSENILTKTAAPGEARTHNPGIAHLDCL